MILKKIVDDFVECNNFEVKIKDRKVRIYYYDKIDSFTSNTIVVSKSEHIIKVKGKNLVIETMFPEYIVISGSIKQLELGYINE